MKLAHPCCLALATWLVVSPPLSSQGDAEPPRGASVTSHLVRPLFLGAAPPQCRALRTIQVAFAEAESPKPGVVRTRAEAHEVAREIVQLARAGRPFDALYSIYADGPPNRGGVLGSYPPGVLLPEIDRFLQAAEVGEVSDPIESQGGLHVVQRIERYAACRYVLIRKRTEGSTERASEILDRARAGESLATIASEFTAEEVQLTERVFERGASDRLVKAATFDAEIGELFGPIDSVQGPLLGRRVAEGVLPESARENSWVRASAILIAHAEVAGPIELSPRSPVEAKTLVDDLFRRIDRGESALSEVAREHNDDLGGRARAGDLGWLYRRNPKMSPALGRLFLAQPGELLGPVPLNLGWLLLRREP